MIIPDIVKADIDDSFFQLSCSEKLPNQLREEFQRYYERVKGYWKEYDKSNSYAQQQLIFRSYYLQLFNKVMQDEVAYIWNQLYTINSARTKDLFKYFVFSGYLIHSDISFVKSKADKHKAIVLLKQETEAFISRIKACEKLFKEYGEAIPLENGDIELMPDPKPASDYAIEALESFLDDIDDIIGEIPREQEWVRRTEQKSRKKSLENAEAIYHIRRLSYKMKRTFGKPYHEYVADMVNAIFGTDYTYDNIAQIVRKR